MTYKSVHGGDIYTQDLDLQKRVLDFSANINPLGLTSEVKRAIVNSIRECINYPDPYCRKLKKALAAFHCVKENWLFIGNGAADVLFRIAFALRPRHTLLLAPTFSDYEKAFRAAGSRFAFLTLQEKQGFKVTRKILGAIQARTDMVVLCNPNNPTGIVMDQELLFKIVNKCAEVGAHLLVDECFLDFVEDGAKRSLVPLLAEQEQLIVLKAFTKTFAMPGLRLGYCLCSDADMLERMSEMGQDWSVSVPAQQAGIAALNDAESYLQEARNVIAEERKYLCDKLSRLNMKIYGCAADYIFFRNIHYRVDLARELRAEGILIRDCSNYRGLGQGFYRVAVKRRLQNRRLIAALKEVIKHALINGNY